MMVRDVRRSGITLSWLLPLVALALVSTVSISQLTLNAFRRCYTQLTSYLADFPRLAFCQMPINICNFRQG